MALGIGLLFLSDKPFIIRILFSVNLFLFINFNMHAFWALGSSRGLPWIDRGGYFIGGLGFLSFLGAVLLIPTPVGYLLVFLGGLFLVIGWALFEWRFDKSRYAVGQEISECIMFDNFVSVKILENHI